MQFRFHGAAREVGRSCIELTAGGERHLLDAGIKFCREGFKYPESLFSQDRPACILLSHAHLDHSGCLPLFEHHRKVCHLFCTHDTLAITKILLKDSYKIAHIKHLHPAWGKTDIEEVRKATTRIPFDRWHEHGSLRFRYLNAGHIPGSAMILLEAEGKRVLYTGDFNTRTTRLMQPADFAAVAKEHGSPDLVITECTYGHRQLPPRPQVEQEFLDAVEATVKRGGVALVPVFAVGRAQEILVMLGERDPGCPIYFDGMAKEVTRSVLVSPSEYIINKDLLHRMYYERVTLIESRERREAAARGPAIIVTTSGMMQGGPAIDYLRHLWHDERNAVLLTGYQVQGTNGYRLLTSGEVPINGWMTPVKCEVRKFDFSGHADAEDIKRAIWELRPKRVAFQHGDPESVEAMAAWARKETPFEVHAPAIGDVIDL